MKLISHLQRSEKYERTSDIFKEIDSEPHRPQKRFKLTINNQEQAKEASKSNIPILWIDPSYTKILKYPMTIPKTIIVPREYKDVIETDLNLHTFESMTPFKDTIFPEFEDVIVFMLTLDPLAARGMVDRSDIDLKYLQKRILQENLEKEASEVYLQDYIDLPYKESPYDKDRLMKIIDRNKVREVIP